MDTICILNFETGIEWFGHRSGLVCQWPRKLLLPLLYICFVPYLTCKLLYQCSLNVETGLGVWPGQRHRCWRTRPRWVRPRAEWSSKSSAWSLSRFHRTFYSRPTVRLFARQSASLLYEPCILSLLQNWDSYNHTGSEDIVNIPCC